MAIAPSTNYFSRPAGKHGKIMSRSSKGSRRVRIVNSYVPNWKPSAVINDEDDPALILDENIATGRSIVEINADFAVLLKSVLS